MANRPNRPWRVMLRRSWSVERGWHEAEKPKCAGTFASREAAEAKAAVMVYRDAYVDGPGAKVKN